ncbi:MAG: hypothetical protein QW213_07690, partial [Thermoproteota archaeon]
MKVAVHITHEALYKVGGIGEVINNLCTTSSYLSFFDKSLLYGPLFEYLGSPSTRLGHDGIVLYSSKDHYDTGRFSELFKPVLEKYNLDLVYGKRKIVNELDPKRSSTVEVLLVDITHIKKEVVDFQKYLFWEKFGISSDLYEKDWDYEQYFRISIPFFELINLLYPSAKTIFFFSHEYMGIPSLLALELSPDYHPLKHKRIFYAHEIAPARRLVESLGGADISFYNILKKAKNLNLSLEDIFGPQDDWYRTVLVKLTERFDKIFSVGDWIIEEYKFLCPKVEEKKLVKVYNAVSVTNIDFQTKLSARKKIVNWIKHHIGYEPDVLITHICRLVKSKGIWRDFILLKYLDVFFQKHDIKGYYILLSSLVPQGRHPQEVEYMIKAYNWPFNHQEGWPDLIGYEIEIYDWVKKFNEFSKHIKALFINQFGFSKYKCPFLIEEDLDTKDLRIASDMEIGLSIYEPFGIAHIEVLPFGGISVPSTSSGVFFFLEEVTKDLKEIIPYYGVDFISIGERFTLESLKTLSSIQRIALEEFVIANIAEEIFKRIPKTLEERIK